MVNLKSILQSVVFEYGLSGAGKGELQKKLEKRASNGEIKVVYISSGDLFRAMKKRINLLREEGKPLSPDEVLAAQLMDSGSQVPSLEIIAPALTDKLEQVMVDQINGEEVAVIFDGILRNGPSEVKGEKFSSQLLQLSEVFARAGKKMIKKHSGLVQTAMARRKIDPTLLRDFFMHEETPHTKVQEEGFIKQIAEGFRKDSSHAIVDVTNEGAEILMRYRSAKVLKELIPSLADKVNEDSSLLPAAFGIVNLWKLQAGRFVVVDGEIKVESHEDREKAVASHKDKDKSFEPFETDEHNIRLVDNYVNEQCYLILNSLGADMTVFREGQSLINPAIDILNKKVSIPQEDLPRADDMLLASRMKRIKEYNEKVVPGILEGELGIKIVHTNKEEGWAKLDLSESRVSEGHLEMIVNGPDPLRRIGFDQFVNEGDLAAGRLFKNLAPMKEGSVRMTERMVV